MKKRALTEWFVRELSGKYEVREAENIARWVIEDLTGRPHLELFLLPDDEWNTADLDKIKRILERLKEEEPIQYILGYTIFSGLKLDLEPGVLIPRNETEELVEWILNDLNGQKTSIRILDVGCGSGAISTSLSYNLPDAEIIAVDISDKAVSICKKNAENNGVNVSCNYMDILKPSGNFIKEGFDIIVSNPPYVLESQRPFLEKRVSEKEPSLALFVPDYDPLMYYKALINFSKEYLQPDGKVYVEINDLLGNETVREFDKYFSDTELRQDIHGKDRMIKSSNGKK